MKQYEYKGKTLSNNGNMKPQYAVLKTAQTPLKRQEIIRPMPQENAAVRVSWGWNTANSASTSA